MVYNIYSEVFMNKSTADGMEENFQFSVSWVVKKKAASSSETLVTYITVRRRNTEDRALNLHRHKNLKSLKSNLT